MTSSPKTCAAGFTLIELLAALVILSALALMSYRGLGAVLEAREHVSSEADKWRRMASFMERFERDVRMSAPRAVRTAPAWLGTAAAAPEPRLEFSRFASTGGGDAPQRVGYGLNKNQEIELWLWPGLDRAPGDQAARYPLVSGVMNFDLQYLNADIVWVDAWPSTPRDPEIPRAVRLRITLTSGEEIVRTFALKS